MPNNSGFWGPPTSSIDWCESNYLHNHYIAETFNTASNAFYLVTSLGAMYRTYRSIRSQKKIRLFDLSRFYLMYTFGLLVCIGSFLFHATLLKKFQLLDELPMMYSQLVVFYIAFFLDDIIKPYSIGLKTLVGGSILLLGIGITIMMLWWPTIYWPFLTVFILLVIYCIYFMSKTAFFSGNNGKSKPIGVVYKQQLFWAFFISLFVAFSCWMVDNLLCQYVESLYLHSFWHLFTSMCVTYMYDFMYVAYLVENKIPFKLEGNIYLLPVYHIIEKSE